MPVFSLPRPGETVLAKTMNVKPGGKGANQALAAQRAGVKTSLVGRVGQDAHAKIALSSLKDENVDLSLVKVSDRETGCAIIMVDKDGENIISVASGANLDVASNQVDDDMLTECDVVLLQQEVLLEQNLRLASRARDRSIPVVYNFAPSEPASEELFSTIDYIIMNKIEASKILTLGAQKEPVEIAKAINRQYGITTVITLGEKGAIAESKSGSFRVSAPVVKVVDTVGSGDTFCGYFAAEIAKGNRSTDSALRIATRAASIACSRYGAQAGIPCRSDVF
tara:strand:- start:20332 stop:21174 length:843 start_codon:yes stop_codon:yes gene_type:complete